MERIKLDSDYSKACFDKKILNKYRDKEITKQRAMRLIAKNNGAESMSEEYFDYLFESLGYSQPDED